MIKLVALSDVRFDSSCSLIAMSAETRRRHQVTRLSQLAKKSA